MFPIVFVVVVFVIMAAGCSWIFSAPPVVIKNAVNLPPPIQKANRANSEQPTVAYHQKPSVNMKSNGGLPGERLEDLSDFRNSGFLRYPENVTNSYDYSHDLSVNHDNNQLSVHHDENEDFMPDFVDYNDA